jgi:hypothetical protein
MNDNDKIAEDYREKTANLRRIMFGGSDNHLSYLIREMEREQCEKEQKKDEEFSYRLSKLVSGNTINYNNRR